MCSRFAQIVQRRYPLWCDVVDVLIYDVRVLRSADRTAGYVGRSQ